MLAHEFSRAQVWNPISCPKPSDQDEIGSCEPGILYDNGIQEDICEDSRFCTIRGWCPPIQLK